ncbi:Zn-dependent hydrolase [Roseibium sp. CAU 1637]|uniref:Zn-dependent hydrolase n=1 Tax=Roseibium limicola TaxID=2816037 RepID=A0A939EK89_9HYPH|nr:Zn-dependent hydrolase [Roseibium limicola]MBO0344099.1 Zn-dependent hydrolase [Roseibium limicola]
MSLQGAKIDLDRLKKLLDGVNQFGLNAVTGGYNRQGYSDEDMACRAWFENVMRADGLDVSRDGAANLFGRFGPEDGPAILIGSHLDTVADGGAYDGSLGVCVALECVRSLQDQGFAPEMAIEVVATAEEEGRFGGMLGSQAIAGGVNRSWIEQATDADGIRLVDALKAQGLTSEGILASVRSPHELAAFLELHIEQGPVLEAEGIPIGVAEHVSGVCYLDMTFTGVANHSGTTPMTHRADAFGGLAELGTFVPEIVGSSGTDQSRITIGHVSLTPNHPHTIPGKANFSVILRDTSEVVMMRLKERIEETAHAIAGKHRLELTSVQRSWLPPVELDKGLAQHLLDVAKQLELPATAMVSGAGHDAQTMQSVCPSALVFIPSRNGISHAPEEYSAWEDIEKGANLLLNSLRELSSRKGGAIL